MLGMSLFRQKSGSPIYVIAKNVKGMVNSNPPITIWEPFTIVTYSYHYKF